MLLDLTVRPLQIHPEECPRSLVVRTMGTGSIVTGIVGRKEAYYAEDTSAHKRKPTPLRVAAEAPRPGGKIYRETRIPLAPSLLHRYRRSEAEDGKQLLPEPFKVTTAYRSVARQTVDVSEVSLIIEHHKERCLVSVQEYGEIPMTIVIKDYNSAPVFEDTELTPLQRLQNQSKDGPTAWSRLLDFNND